MAAVVLNPSITLVIVVVAIVVIVDIVIVVIVIVIVNGNSCTSSAAQGLFSGSCAPRKPRSAELCGWAMGHPFR